MCKVLEWLCVNSYQLFISILADIDQNNIELFIFALITMNQPFEIVLSNLKKLLFN